MANSTNTETFVPTADDYRAFADYLANGGKPTSPDAWFQSDAGKASRQAAADQAKAAAKASRLSDARATARDIRDNGEITAYSAVRAARTLAYLQTVDFPALLAEVAKAEAK